MSQKPSKKTLQTASNSYVVQPLDTLQQMLYSTGVQLDGDGRVWLRLGTTRRCLLQIVNGRIVFRFRDAKLDGSIRGVEKRGGSANLDAVVKGARGAIHGDQLVITIPVIPNQNRET